MPKRRPRIFLLAICLLCDLNFYKAVGAQGETPLPVDTTLAMKQFGAWAPIALSPDGNWLAYTIRDERRAKAMDTETFPRTGVHGWATGTDIWLKNLKTGETGNLTESKGDNWLPAWSPDARYLVFLSDRDGGGKARVWVWDALKKDMHKVSERSLRTDKIEWFPDSRRIIVTASPEHLFNAHMHLTVPGSGVTTLNPADAPSVSLYRDVGVTQNNTKSLSDPWSLDDYLSDLVTMDVTEGTVRTIVKDKRISSYYLSSDRLHIAYTTPEQFEKPGSQQILFSLTIVDLRNNRDRVIRSGIRLDYDGAAFSWSPDGRRLALQTGGTGEETDDCYVVDINDGVLHNVSTLPALGRARRYRSTTPIWDGDGNTFYFIRDGELWRASADNSKAEKVASIHDRTIIQIISAPGDLIWTPDGGKSAIVVTHDDSGKQDGIYNISLVNGQNTKLLEEGQCYSCVNAHQHFTVAADGQQVVYFAEDAQHAQDLWMSDPAFHNPRQLTHLNEQFYRYRMGSARLIHWLSGDGELLQGALLLPANYREGARYPLVVWVYGGALLSEDFDHFGLTSTAPFNMQLLATRGYAVLAPDAPLHPGTPMFDLAKTILPGVDEAIRIGIADPDHLGVIGHSFGGYSTLALIVQTKRFKAAVDVSGFGNLVGVYGEMDKEGKAFGTAVEEGPSLMGGTPWQFRDRYIENSPSFYLDKVGTPLLIVHGSKDTAVASFLGDEIFVGLRRLGKEVEYAEYQGESHSPQYWSYPNQVDFCKRMIAWFDLHLKAPIPSDTPSPAR